MILDKEYIIFSDESDKKGVNYSNFYGGLIIGSTQYEKVTNEIIELKNHLNFYGEIKWQKVTEQYLDKYINIITYLFRVISQKRIKIRIMFRENSNQAVNLTNQHISEDYFKLYYQFLKHAFGFSDISGSTFLLRIYLDEFPHKTKEQIRKFKEFVLKLGSIYPHLILKEENITEITSKEHVLLQCLDVVLGAMCFRLNDKHKLKLENNKIGKRTIAKEKLYNHIYSEICKIKPNFNIGRSTWPERDTNWESSYLHWSFVPKRNNPVKPTKEPNA